MKRIVSLLLATSLLLLPLPALAAAGAGTPESPYLVSSVSDVLAMQNDLSACYKLTADIDMKDVDFEPIGNEETGVFTGVIDGDGHTLSNLDLNLPERKYVGFVGCLEGTVKNLNLSKVNACGYCYVGTVAGYLSEDAVIDNCTASGYVTGEGIIGEPYTGGIVGSGSGTISHCTNDCEVENSVHVSGYARGIAGGIVGYASSGILTIIGCINNGDISSYHPSGGMVGSAHNCALIVTDCSNLGDISEHYSGGLAGEVEGGSFVIRGCTNGGTIKGYYESGGIVGSADSNQIRTITDCVNNGTVSQTSTSQSGHAGGIVGQGGATISDCINNGGISGIYAYGIGGTPTNSTNYSTVFSTNYIWGGGAYGITSGTAYNCLNCGNIGADDSYCEVYGTAPTAYNCVNRGTLTGTVREGTVYNLTLCPAVVQLGASFPIGRELYGYDRELTWASSSPSVVKVDQSGVVTGVSLGAATISATTELGVVGSALVTVKSEASGVTLNRSELTLQVGFTDLLTAAVVPADSTDTITWSSSRKEIATVDQNGVVTGVSPGTAAISARADSGQTAYCLVTVRSAAVPVSSVKLDASERIMTLGDCVQLAASVLPENADDRRLSWTSSDSCVAVSATGVCTALSMGTATITATSGNGLSDSCLIKVISASGPSVVLSGGSVYKDYPGQVKASIVQNPGITAYKFTVQYDPEIATPTEIVPNPEFGGHFTTNLADAERDALNVLWYSDSAVTEDGELFTVTFEQNASAQAGAATEVSLRYGNRDICDADGNYIALYTGSASLTVEKPLPGDVYEDRDVTVYDLHLLSRYVTGLETFTERQRRIGDVNQDSQVDIKDVVRLAQYLVGWHDVELASVDRVPAARSKVRAASTARTRAVTAEDSSVTLKIDSSAVNGSQEAYLPVSMEESANIAGFRFQIGYDPDEVEILEIIPNTALLPENFQTNLNQEGKNGLLVTWYQEENKELSGELFKLRVRYTGSGVSKIMIHQAVNNMCNENLESVLGEYREGFVLSGKCVPVERSAGKVELYSDASYAGKSVTAVYALYNGNRMISSNMQKVTLNAEKQALVFSVPQKEYETSKIILLDSENGYAPLTP